MGTEPAFGFSRILERLLHHRYPDQAFEVINLAMRGINSHMIRRIAMERQFTSRIWSLFMLETTSWSAGKPQNPIRLPFGH